MFQQPVESIDLARIMFEAGVSLSAILIAVIGILIVEYHAAKSKGLTDLYKPYKILIWAMAIVFVGTTISNLLILFSLYGWQPYQIAVGFFIFIMITLSILVVVMIWWLLK